MVQLSYNRYHYTARLGPCQKSIVEFFEEKVNGFYSSAIFAKSFIIDVWQGPKCIPDNVISFILTLNYYKVT